LGQRGLRKPIPSQLHGLTSETLVLPSEDPAEFHALLTAYIQQFQPDGPVELDLVHEIVAAKWRLDRIALIETQLFTDAIAHEEDHSDHPLTPTQALTGAFERLANHNSFAVLHRMESRLGRAYSRALRNLLQLQRLRQQPAEPATPRPAPGENKICKNEPTDAPTDGGYLNAPPDASTTEIHSATQLPPIPAPPKAESLLRRSP